MTVYIIQHNQQSTKHISNILFPLVTKLETGNAYDYRDINRDANNKPQPINGLFYNISHNNHYWCIIFSEKECGIDIEDIARTINRPLSKRILSSNEEPVDGSILKTWVLKEAYAKYLGQGISLGFKTITTKDIFQKYHVTDLSSDSYICFAVQHDDAPINLIRASLVNNELLL